LLSLLSEAEDKLTLFCDPCHVCRFLHTRKEQRGNDDLETNALALKVSGLFTTIQSS
jgi:hypothetical protein